MRTNRFSCLTPAILGAFALTLSACVSPYSPHEPKETNHFLGKVSGIFTPYQPHSSQSPSPHSYKKLQKNPTHTNKSGHSMSRLSHRAPQFQQWVDYEPEYRLYPGDQIDIVVSSAPELSRTLTVGPDGRIVMPMIKPVMAAGHTFTQLQAALSADLATQLRDPRIAITPRAYAPQQIYVGGEVGTQGTYTLPGPIGAIEAVLMAGGLRPSAKASQIAVFRRAPNGGMMMRIVNLKDPKNMPAYDDVMQLKRGDIVFVPRTTLAEAAAWMQIFRDALPVDFNLSYQFGSDNFNNGATAFISP